MLVPATIERVDLFAVGERHAPGRASAMRGSGEEVVIELRQGGLARIRVVDEAGMPVAGCKVMPPWGGAAVAVTNDGGEAVLGCIRVERGEMSLRFMHGRYVEEMRLIAVSDDMVDVVLREVVQLQLAVLGRVGQHVAGVNIELRGEDDGVAWRGTTSLGGTCVVRCAKGRYDLVATGRWKVVGGQELTVVGGLDESHEVVVSELPVAVAGRVVDGGNDQGVERAVVVLMDDSGIELASATTGEGGVFAVLAEPLAIAGVVARAPGFCDSNLIACQWGEELHGTAQARGCLAGAASRSSGGLPRFDNASACWRGQLLALRGEGWTWCENRCPRRCLESDGDHWRVEFPGSSWCHC